jgi:hypothetical protein
MPSVQRELSTGKAVKWTSETIRNAAKIAKNLLADRDVSKTPNHVFNSQLANAPSDAGNDTVDNTLSWEKRLYEMISNR